MKFVGIDRRIRRLEPPPIMDQEKLEHAELFQACFNQYFINRLIELGCNSIADDVKAQITEIDDLIARHQDLVYRLDAANLLATADMHIELGDPEDSKDVQRFRETAARILKWEAQEKQTICDKCGCNLSDWSCLIETRDRGIIKVCRNCSGSLAGA